MGNPVNVITPAGQTIAVDEAHVPTIIEQGGRLESPSEAHAAGVERVLDEKYSGFGAGVEALARGAARGLTMGLSDVVSRDQEAVEELKERQPVLSSIGEFGGAALPALVPGGAAGAAGKLLASTPAGLSARAARSVAGRLGKGVAASAVEGAIDAGLYSAGQTFSQAVLGDDPLTVEQVAANIGLGTVLGGVTGGALGLLGKGGAALGKREVAKANPLLVRSAPETKELGKRIGLELGAVHDDIEAAVVARRQHRAAELYPGMRDVAQARAEGRMVQDLSGNAAEEGGARAPNLADGTPQRGPGTVPGKRRVAEGTPAEPVAPRPKRELMNQRTVPGGAPDDVIDALALRNQRTVVDNTPPAKSDTIVEPFTGAMRKAEHAEAKQAAKLEAKRPKAVEAPADPGVTRQVVKETPQPQMAQGTPTRTAEIDEITVFEGATAKAAQEYDPVINELNAARRVLSKYTGEDLALDLPYLIRARPDRALDVVQKFDDYAAALTKAEKIGRVDVAPALRDEALLLEKLSAGLPGNTRKSLEQLRAIKGPDELAQMLGTDVAQVSGFKTPAGKLLARMYAMGRVGETQLARNASAKAAAKAEAATAGGFFRSQLGEAVDYGLRRAAGAAVATAVGAPWWTGWVLARAAGGIGKKLEDGAVNALGLSLRTVGSKPVRTAATFTAAEVLSNAKFGADTGAGTPAMQRVRELHETRSNPEGMRSVINERLAPLRAHNLQLGFEVESRMMDRLAYYAEHAPVPPPPALGVKQNWKMSKAQEYELAIRVRAGEQPLTLLEDFANNRLNMAAVETVEALWPELYTQMQQTIIEQMSSVEEVPYLKRRQASIFFKVAVEPTLEPDFVGLVQEGYAMKHEMEQKQSAAGIGGTPKAPGATKGQRLEAR